jgi:hypothetical protein
VRTVAGVLQARPLSGRRAQVLAIAWFAIWSVPSIAILGAHDAITYLAAGERLNAGHALYALGPGDRAVELWQGIPINYPPAIAVLWRPIAALGVVGVGLWYAGLFLAMGWAIWIIARRAPVAAIAAGPAVGYLCASGNVHGFVLPLLLGLWIWRDHPLVSAGLGAITAIKFFTVGSVPILWRWGGVRALAMFAAGGLAMTAIGVLGAGLGPTIDYPRLAAGWAPQPFALSWVFGIAWLSPVLFVIGTLVTFVLPYRAAYLMAIITMVVFNPAGLWIASGSLLVLLAAPRQSRLGMLRPEGAPRGRRSSISVPALSAPQSAN